MVIQNWQMRQHKETQMTTQRKREKERDREKRTHVMKGDYGGEKELKK